MILPVRRCVQSACRLSVAWASGSREIAQRSVSPCARSTETERRNAPKTAVCCSSPTRDRREDLEASPSRTFENAPQRPGAENCRLLRFFGARQTRGSLLTRSARPRFLAEAMSRKIRTAKLRSPGLRLDPWPSVQNACFALSAPTRACRGRAPFSPPPRSAQARARSLGHHLGADAPLRPLFSIGEPERLRGDWLPVWMVRSGPSSCYPRAGDAAYPRHVSQRATAPLSRRLARWFAYA
jgi:hypothetical protein